MSLGAEQETRGSYTTPGYLSNGQQWYYAPRCPMHGTWLQPAFTPIKHWACMVEGCTFVRAAKMRNKIVRYIFDLYEKVSSYA